MTWAKDVVESLVADGEVQSDKVGAQARATGEESNSTISRAVARVRSVPRHRVIPSSGQFLDALCLTFGQPPDYLRIRHHKTDT